jgi:hypothetical protein
MAARVRRRPPLSRRATIDWHSGGAGAVGLQWCCGHLATASASHKLAGNAPRSRIAHESHLRASDRRAWKVATWPRRLCAKASFQVGSNAALQPPCGSGGIGNGPRCSRGKPDRTPRVRWPHRRPAGARVESSCGRRGSPVPEQAFQVGSKARRCGRRAAPSMPACHADAADASRIVRCGHAALQPP